MIVDASPEKVWQTVGNFAEGPRLTTPDIFVDCRLIEPDLRQMTFADGNVVRERLIARDEQARRIVWAWEGEEVSHDNTSMQVFAENNGRSRLVWIHDTAGRALRLACRRDGPNWAGDPPLARKSQLKTGPVKERSGHAPERSFIAVL
ncbi:SRPBCC family protein [Mesorhizobium sp.]|uniref:SRPBCC family protein n=1 Tax=Mesorhizobium sp. TaxID=1871066 RepID=UPI000FE48724|nr:SRPBCC family protein [Mesorhizobium sp.]RWO89456.1 MAG: SRPBCC family protein [Mesorhizobium sp.]